MTKEKGTAFDYETANELADQFFTLINQDGRLTPKINPNEIITIANLLVISVLKSIDDPNHRVYAANLIANKIRSLPEFWRDKANVLH